MSGQVYSRFFWSDWQSDPRLRLCSLAARGLWMEMLCLAAQSEPIGYVVVNGKTPDATMLARLTGDPQPGIETAFAELEENGVFSRDAKGRIYSRRMLRDEKKAATARENGKNGGNPSLCKRKGNSASVNPSLVIPLPLPLPEPREEPLPEAPEHTKEPLTSFEAEVGLAAELPAPKQKFISDEIWSFKADLVALSGRSDLNMRTWIGSMLKKHEHAALRDAIKAAVAVSSRDPLAYVSGCLRPPRDGPTRRGGRPHPALSIIQECKEIYDAERDHQTFAGSGETRIAG